MMDESGPLPRSDLEPEVTHALQVRLNQVGTLLCSVLDYARGEKDECNYGASIVMSKVCRYYSPLKCKD